VHRPGDVERTENEQRQGALEDVILPARHHLPI
jgi:hypothetical protein